MAQTIRTVSDNTGIGYQLIRDYVKTHEPSWATKPHGIWKVDEFDPLFKEFVLQQAKTNPRHRIAQQKGAMNQKAKTPPKSLLKKKPGSTTTKKSEPKKTTQPTKPIHPQETKIDPEEKFNLLREQSMEATLTIPVKKLQLDMYKIENERLKLKRLAGDLIDFALAEFLFFGYMERINAEKLMFPKKLAPRIEQVLTDTISRAEDPQKINTKELTNEIVRWVIREEEEIIRSVKAHQQEDLKSWQGETDA